MTREVIAVDLLDRYAAVLIDAYGVLVTSGGALEGAAAFVSELERRGMPWAVVTNDCSRSAETAARSYAARGVEVPASRVVTSGSLLRRFFADRGLCGARTAVMGTDDSRAYVREAGGVVVGWSEEAEVLVIGDEAGYPFLDAFDTSLSHVIARVRRGVPVTLVVPNPDIVYPKREAAYGVASGGIASMFEQALGAVLGAEAPSFERLGKPAPAMFEAAMELVGTRDCVMLGDQLSTDIRGARAAGIDSAFVCTGVGELDGSVEPDWVVRRLVR